MKVILVTLQWSLRHEIKRPLRDSQATEHRHACEGTFCETAHVELLIQTVVSAEALEQPWIVEAASTTPDSIYSNHVSR